MVTPDSGYLKILKSKNCGFQFYWGEKLGNQNQRTAGSCYF
jgi:hypothetical protein